MIRVSPKAMTEANRISSVALNSRKSIWQEAAETALNISTLNVRSLVKHLADISHDHILLGSHIMCINETFLTSSDSRDISIRDYAVYACGEGRGKGVAVYVKEAMPPVRVLRADSQHYQIIKVGYLGFDVIAIYISPSISDNIGVLDDLDQMIEADRCTVVCGDINCNANGEAVTALLNQHGFTQIVDQPTHIQGGTLDHFYVRPLTNVIDHFVHPLYFSDHDAVCVSMAGMIC